MKYTVISRDQIGGRVTVYKADNRSFEMVKWFKYVRTTLMSQNSVHEEIISRWKSGNACYHSVQNFLLSNLLSKNIKIKTCRTIILPVVLYRCETWSLTWREECRLRLFENRVLRIFGPMKDGITGVEKYI
jgi:hypothetical protein